MSGSEMMKIGIVGLGDIATKAYLPVLSTRADLELHLCSRSATRMKELGDQYKIPHQYSNVESLLTSGIKAAFVHTATTAHFDIAETLLQNGIHVYVDKPITMEYQLSKKLVALAESKSLIFMVGFNRRYAPAYCKLKEMNNPSVIIMQKNRKSFPDNLRRFVVEDFIHVIDTLRYLFPYPIAEITVNGRRSGELLHHLVVQFISKEGNVAIGIMDRDTGTTEEKIEVTAASEKRTVYNLVDLFIEKERSITKIVTSDWESTLYRRGFDHMLDDFLNALKSNGKPMISGRDALLTHEIAEYIVEQLDAKCSN
jgi:virulence factor